MSPAGRRVDRRGGDRQHRVENSCPSIWRTVVRRHGKLLSVSVEKSCPPTRNFCCPLTSLLLGTTSSGWLAFRVITSGGGASKSQPLPIPGQPFHLGERRLAIPTCRDGVVAAVETWVVGGGLGFTVERVHGAMASCGSPWSRETVAKTMLRMTRPPVLRPHYLQLERTGINRYRVCSTGQWPFRLQRQPAERSGPYGFHPFRKGLSCPAGERTP